MDSGNPALAPGRSNPHDLGFNLNDNKPEDDSNDAAQLRRSWKGKEKAVDAPHSSENPQESREPLTLLRLPIDILRLIFNELSKREDNQLLVLVLVNSTLHDLVTPYIHSRFDIVWPQMSLVGDFSSSYVDALTHGLSVYALGSRFAQTLYRVNRLPPPTGRPPIRTDYARHVRRFNIQNGPSKWVSDYYLRTESGKMLNTLTALAVQKMTSLESFKWDMPTDVSSDVFMALASLADQSDNHSDTPSAAAARHCNLQEVWIRCHDAGSAPSSSSSSSSSFVAPPPPPGPGIGVGAGHPPQGPPMPPPQPGSNASTSQGSWRSRPRLRRSYSGSLIEYPTFSVLPPVRSLAILDMPSMAYVDEAAVLIERSKSVLRELRLSITASSKAQGLGRIAEKEDNLKQYDEEALWPGDSRIRDCRLGGVLGAALARIFDMRKHLSQELEPSSPGGLDPKPPSPATASTTSPTPTTSTSVGQSHKDSYPDASDAIDGRQASDSTPSDAARQPTMGSNSKETDTILGGTDATQTILLPSRPVLASSSEATDHVADKLALERLELARISLHATLCVNAFDWTVLTSLTILACNHQEKLWGALRTQFRPTKSKRKMDRGTGRSRSSTDARQYRLRIRNLHVDITSFALLNFIKETLAPNSLEQLFLHDKRNAPAPLVPIDEVFSAGIKRHQASLKKLLLDASPTAGIAEFRSMCWALTLDMVLYLTSGRMAILQELSVCFGAESQWHTFLQRLPNLPNLTALNAPYIGGSSGSLEADQLGLQIVDIITLRPEVKLCFVGLRSRCFQVVETKHGSAASEDSRDSSDSGASVSSHSDLGHVPNVTDVSGSENDDDEGMVSGDNSDLDSVTSQEPELWPASTRAYRLKEILFFDDKVDIFRARHGTL